MGAAADEALEDGKPMGLGEAVRLARTLGDEQRR